MLIQSRSGGKKETVTVFILQSFLYLNSKLVRSCDKTVIFTWFFRGSMENYPLNISQYRSCGYEAQLCLHFTFYDRFSSIIDPHGGHVTIAWSHATVSTPQNH